MKIFTCPKTITLSWFVLLVIFSIFIFPALSHAEALSVTVTITQQVPIETISADGTVIGVKKSTLGTKLILVNVNGSNVVLQDTDGTRYQIAAGATDYIPPTPAPISSPTNSIIQAPPSPTPVPPPSPSPSSANLPDTNTAHPDPDPPSPSTNQGSVPDGAVTTVTIGERRDVNLLAVWPPGGMAGRPLLVASHGGGGSGPKEINGWLQLAKRHRFTIVCPSFLSAKTNSIYIPQDVDYFKECLHWIKDNLQYDKDNVFMTGFSGGGFPTWYLATQRPDFFKGLFLQSGNFSGPLFDFDLSRWENKPIKIIWGSEDAADIPGQNQQAIALLESAHCKNYSTEIIQGAHHQPHHDLVVTWMEQQIASTPASPN